MNRTGNPSTPDRFQSGTTRPSLASSYTGGSSLSPASAASGSGELCYHF